MASRSPDGLPTWVAALRRVARTYLLVVAMATLFVSVFAATYIIANHERVFPADDHLVVYGNDSCAITTRLRSALQAEDIPFEYANIDSPFVNLEMWIKLGYLTGKASSARLPVVDLGGRVLQRPDHRQLVADLRSPTQPDAAE